MLTDALHIISLADGVRPIPINNGRWWSLGLCGMWVLGLLACAVRAAAQPASRCDSADLFDQSFDAGTPIAVPGLLTAEESDQQMFLVKTICSSFNNFPARKQYIRK